MNLVCWRGTKSENQSKGGKVSEPSSHLRAMWWFACRVRCRVERWERAVWLCGSGSPNNSEADREINLISRWVRRASFGGTVGMKCYVSVFSTASSWGLSFESQSRHYLTDYEPVISLPSSLRKEDSMWQIRGPRWQISQEFAVISTTHFTVRLRWLELGGNLFYFASLSLGFKCELTSKCALKGPTTGSSGTAFTLN